MHEALREAYPFPDDTRIFLREWPLNNGRRPQRVEDQREAYS
jgi:hypothetical protein